MPRKFTQKEAKVQFKNLGFNLLSRYNGITSKVMLSCRNKHIFETKNNKFKINLNDHPIWE